MVFAPDQAVACAGAFAFAVAFRRSRLRVLCLGADAPVASWLEVVREHPHDAVARGAVTAEWANSAATVADALRSAQPDMLVAVGGSGGGRIAANRPDVMLLSDSLHAGAAMLVRRLESR